MSSDFCNPNHRKLDMPDSSSSDEDDDQQEADYEKSNENSKKIEQVLPRNEELKLCENLNKI